MGALLVALLLQASALEYDSRAPLDVIEAGRERRDAAVVHDISYTSPKGGRVTAFLVVPVKAGRHAAVIWGHWYWENSPLRNRKEFLDEAIALAGSGVVSLLTDGPIARPGFVPKPDPLDERRQDELVQQVIDMRRGADLLLARKDVDPRRLAYVGHSYNASVGGILAGLDRRFKAFVLMAGGLSNAQDVAGPEYQRYRERIGAETFDAFFAKYAWLDPGRFLPQAAPASVFLQFATQERFLTPERARGYAAIVSEPKRLLFYDAPHALDAAARRDRLAFLAAQLAVPPVPPAAIAAIPELEQPLLPGPAYALLERAIAAAGGTRALDAAAALAWKGRATIHLPDRKLEIAGTWKLEPPDRAVVETHLAGQDPATARTMIISGARGFSLREGKQTALPDAMVEHERGQFHLYYVLRLAPLRHAPYVLDPLKEDADGRVGFRVRHPERPSVEVYFDEAARPRRLVSEITDPASGAKQRQVVTLEGDAGAAGIHWPRALHIAWDDKPYFDLEISALEVMPKLHDARLDAIDR
jgi:dienelactone hydrolase